MGNGICLAMYNKGGGAASGLLDVIGYFSEEVECSASVSSFRLVLVDPVSAV